jgi:drug/metabolite transporter (DMT)-like permease
MTALLALLSSALWGTADFLGGTASRRLAPLVVVVISQGVALAGLLVLVTALGYWDDPSGYLPFAVSAGVLGMVSLVAFYQALAEGTMGIVAPIAATGVIVPVALGLVAGERPSLLQGLGIVVAVAGIILASGPEFGASRAGSRARQVLVLAALAAVGFGLVLWLVAKGSHYSVPMTLLSQRMGSVGAGLLLMLVWRRGLRIPDGAPDGTAHLRWRDLRVLAVIGVGDVGANGLYAISSRSGLVSLVAVLSSLYPVTTVLLARFVHHERLRPVQNVGVVAALAGVVLIGAGGAL